MRCHANTTVDASLHLLVKVRASPRRGKDQPRRFIFALGLHHPLRRLPCSFIARKVQQLVFFVDYEIEFYVTIT